MKGTTIAVLAAMFACAAGLPAGAEDAAAPAPAAAPAAVAPADAAPAAAAPAVKKPVKKKKVVRRKVKKPKKAAVPAAVAAVPVAVPAPAPAAGGSLASRLASIDAQLAALPSAVAAAASSPFSDSLATQVQVIRFSLARYGKYHGEAMGMVIAGHVVRNLTWITGTGLALAGYANAVKVDSPALNDYKLCVVGGAVIGVGQVVASLLDIMGMAKESAAGGELLAAMEAAKTWERPRIKVANPEENLLPAVQAPEPEAPAKAAEPPAENPKVEAEKAKEEAGKPAEPAPPAEEPTLDIP